MAYTDPPEDRRVIFSSYVVPKETYTTSDLEETTGEGFTVGRADYTKDRIDTNVNKRLGGKGIATITPTQWNDGWTSMFHSKVNWEDLTDNVDWKGNRWKDEYTCWDGTRHITTTQSLTPSVDAFAPLEDVPMEFLYIKNLGDSVNVDVNVGLPGTSWNGESEDWEDRDGHIDDDFTLIIPPGASVCLRGDGTALDCTAINVQPGAGDSGGAGTTIEYLIAK